MPTPSAFQKPQYAASKGIIRNPGAILHGAPQDDNGQGFVKQIEKSSNVVDLSTIVHKKIGRAYTLSLSEKLACGDLFRQNAFPLRFQRGRGNVSWRKRPVQPDFFDMLRRPALSCAGRLCMLLQLSRRRATSSATTMPLTPACIRPRVMPAPSPAANRPLMAVSIWLSTSTLLE